MARAVGLDPREGVVVALSGGADSVYLLHAVARARPAPQVVAVHLEHGLRGAEGDEDAAFCARLCQRLCVPFVRRALELDPAGPSLEARARAERYRVLCEEALRAGVTTILTGHHADDALETLLQRWLRGTHLSGLAGLRARTELRPGLRPDAPAARRAHERLNLTGGTLAVVRPLIAMRREEVRRLLEAEGLEWREDSSNAGSRFTRNRVRHELLPAIERECGPEALENLRAFGAVVEELEERCADLTAPLAWTPPPHAAARGSAAGAFDPCGSGGTIERAALEALASPLRRRALWRLIVEGTGRAAGRTLLDPLLDDLARGRRSVRNLPGGWTLRLGAERLRLDPPPASSADDPALPARELRLELPGMIELPDGRRIEADLVHSPPGEDVPRSALEADLDARDFVDEPPFGAPPLSVRFARAGDRFHPFGGPGSRPLARFLADAGVPRADRGRVPLVFAGEELVWVAGIRPCETRRVRPGTSARLRLSLHVPAGAGARPR